jgi:hypothetical protein
MPALDLARFRDLATRKRACFAAADPFPHVVLDDFLRQRAADILATEFARLPEAWTYYRHVNEQKRGFADLSRMTPECRAVIEELLSEDFARALEVLTGITSLFADPELDGGGLHETAPGGFLNVHHDFLSHTTHPSWSRQVNLLVFLNRGWQESYRGWLEFWDAGITRPVQRIAPVFNRAVIFRTDRRSFHGVPAGVACPAGTTRKSLALYYFRDEGRPCQLAPTHYVPRPEDPPLRRAFIRLDRRLLYVYSALKRYTPLGDRLVSAILRRL